MEIGKIAELTSLLAAAIFVTASWMTEISFVISPASSFKVLNEIVGDSSIATQNF